MDPKVHFSQDTSSTLLVLNRTESIGRTRAICNEKFPFGNMFPKMERSAKERVPQRTVPWLREWLSSGHETGFGILLLRVGSQEIMEKP